MSDEESLDKVAAEFIVRMEANSSISHELAEWRALDTRHEAAYTEQAAVWARIKQLARFPKSIEMFSQIVRVAMQATEEGTAW